MTEKEETGKFLYFIQVGDDGPIKIGIASDPASRVKTLQVGNHEHLRLLAYFEPINAKDAEDSLHNHFRHLKIKGEWFKPRKYLLDSIRYIVDFGLLSFWDKIEDEWQKAWEGIAPGYHHFQLTARSYRELGDFKTLEYIIKEAEELVYDLKHGQF